MYSIVFIDSEISTESGKILDLGAIKGKSTTFHSPFVEEFSRFVAGSEYICGHNIIAHDLKYIGRYMDQRKPPIFIDTLYLSPLFFPCHQHHSLLKDDKLQTDALNNPLNDAKKARDLFFDELNAFQNLSPDMKKIYESLLSSCFEFSGFFQFNSSPPASSTFSLKLLFKSAAKPFHGQMVRVLKFSKACLQRLAELSRKGYQPDKAVIRFIVAWKAEEDNEESAVILPNLYLKRR